MRFLFWRLRAFAASPAALQSFASKLSMDSFSAAPAFIRGIAGNAESAPGKPMIRS